MEALIFTAFSLIGLLFGITIREAYNYIKLENRIFEIEEYIKYIKSR